VDQAEQIWKGYTPPLRNSSQLVFEMMLSLARNNHESAEAALSKAEQASVTENDQIWVHVGRAQLSMFDGDKAAALSEMDTANQMLKRGLFEADFSDSLIGYVQFLMNSLPRDFLPQVYYPVDDPVLLHIIHQTVSGIR
ncbi:MAG TPA: hypothetical protein VLK33_17635, partial [Terriglobales bacterium]|nr:hypothetical protein [Terriglobales bacterium]